MARLRQNQESGQISILIVLSLLPMFTLFAFAVNVGMLVNAKISLQNAADLAAYAGAATQARQLTNISHLNYEMRQVYKKFIYKYYLLGNLSQKCFPRSSSTPGCQNAPPDGSNFDWLNRDNSGATTGFPGVPMVCISLSTESNPCQLSKPVPVVQQPACILLDPTCAALQNAAVSIAAIQQKSCTANSVINVEVLTHWLYATTYNIPIQSNVNLQGLINDIGLVPEELILKTRVDNVSKFINAKPQVNVTAASLRGLESVPEQSTVERTILAYKTAMNNLNADVFDFENDTVSMTELLPSGGDGANLLALEYIQPTFDGVYSYMEGSPAQCTQKLETITAKPYVAVFKKPESYVYYAVKLTAKARLLFNPFPFGHPDDGLNLTAYAAAAPFGSRIGPIVKETDFVRQGTANNGGVSMPVRVPILTVDDGLTFENTALLKSYHGILRGEGANQSIGTAAVNSDDLVHGIHSVMLPDTFEVGKYNIPVDADPNDASHGFMPYFADASTHATSCLGGFERCEAFWAPIIPVGGQDKFKDDMTTELGNIASALQAQSVGSNPTGAARQGLTQILLTQLDTLMGTLAQIKVRTLREYQTLLV